METRQRGVYPTARQKRKLIELLTKHPKLISCKLSQDFNHADSQRLWCSIASECNSIPGARKTWRQWRKTWQDIRSKAKKKQAINGALPSSVTMLSTAEQEALGIKNVSSTTNYQEATEFIPIDEEYTQDTSDIETGSHSDPEYIPEQKVFDQSEDSPKKKKPSKNQDSEHSNSCLFNCDMMAAQEEKKLQIKKDYYNFKKEYLSQKLLYMKEQTEALKNIAKKLAK